MSIALAIKNSPMLCLVFFARKRTEKSPPINPANKGIYFCFYYDTHLRREHRRVLNMPTKLPKNRPKRIASFPSSIFMS